MEKYLVVCDLHGYYFWQEALEEIFRREGRADGVIFGGDTTDLGALSKYVERSWVSPRQDLDRARRALELAQDFAPVRVLEGNHCRRVEKKIVAELDRDLHFLTNPHAVSDYITDGLDNVSVVGHEIFAPDNSRLNMVWAHWIGDALIAHAETGANVPMRAAERVMDWVGKWRLPLGLPDTRVVVQGHTHRFGKSPVEGGHKLLMEGGSLVRLAGMGYGIERGDLKYGPPQRGYIRLIQENGKSDFNGSGFILMETSVPSARNPDWQSRKAATNAIAAGGVPAAREVMCGDFCD